MSTKVNWEAFFEAPGSGLIPLVQQAKTAATMRAITGLLVDQLYVRTDDSDPRQSYRNELEQMLDDGTPIDIARDEIVAFLRRIKDDRIKRSNAKRAVSGPPQIQETEDRGADHFRRTFLKSFENRFKVIQEGVQPIGREPLPFLCSDIFAAQFLDMVENTFLPEITDMCRGGVTRCDHEDPGNRSAFMNGLFNDKQYKMQIFEAWKKVWEKHTEIQELPAKPKEEKTGLLGKFIKKKDDQPAWMREMTMEEWQIEVGRIELDNEKAEKTWAEISEETPMFHPPTDDDKKVIGELWGRTPQGIQKQLTAITQIALQGRSIQAFESYQRGKNLDVALLSVSYRHPDTFLGKKGFLFDIMRGYNDSMRAQIFPLVNRYLLDG